MGEEGLLRGQRFAAGAGIPPGCEEGFRGTLIRWCRRDATQPPANLCYPSGIKRERALEVQAASARREDRTFRASGLGCARLGFQPQGKLNGSALIGHRLSSE